MTTVIQSSTEDVISLPVWLMKLLDLQEGEEIKTVVEGKTLRLTPLENFLALRGVLQDDQEFDAAIEYLNQARIWNHTSARANALGTSWRDAARYRSP